MSKCGGNHFEALERNNTCNSTSKLRSSLFCDMQCKGLKCFTSTQEALAETKAYESSCEVN